MANTGYHFVNWSDGITTATRTDTNVTANKSVTANFAVNVSYTITSLAGAGGSISPAGAVSVSGGSNQVFTITPDSGFSISQVLVDGVDQGAVSTYTFTNVVTAHTISATFVLGGGGGTQTTTLDMGDSEWFDARLGASGPWGTFSIYANGVLIGTKTADGTSTWNCPQTDVPSGARIDIVADVGFTDPLEVYDYYTPHTFTTYLPAGVTRLEAATWSGFPLLTSGDGADGYNWGYPENDYTYVYLAPATITGIMYSTGPSFSIPLPNAAGQFEAIRSEADPGAVYGYYRIYLDDVEIGSIDPAGPTTWNNTTRRSLSTGASHHIDITYDAWFGGPGGSGGPVTETAAIPSEARWLEIATWTGFTGVNKYTTDPGDGNTWWSAEIAGGGTAITNIVYSTTP